MSEIEEARADYQSAMLTQRADIWRAQSGQPDGWGGLGNRLSCVLRGTPARAQRPQGRSAEEGSQSVAVSDWEILLPVGTNAAKSDEIRIGEYTYEVTSSDAGVEGAMALRVACTKKDSK